MLNVVMLSFVMLNVVMLSVVMLGVVILNVIMLSVVVLNGAAPLQIVCDHVDLDRFRFYLKWLALSNFNHFFKVLYLVQDRCHNCF
jgi:hypothetical protein